jgi:hypothetical protein
MCRLAVQADLYLRAAGVLCQTVSEAHALGV